jgi:hypothetical protein
MFWCHPKNDLRNSSVSCSWAFTIKTVFYPVFILGYFHAACTMGDISESDKNWVNPSFVNQPRLGFFWTAHLGKGMLKLIILIVLTISITANEYGFPSKLNGMDIQGWGIR